MILGRSPIKKNQNKHAYIKCILDRYNRRLQKIASSKTSSFEGKSSLRGTI